MPKGQGPLKSGTQYTVGGTGGKMKAIAGAKTPAKPKPAAPSMDAMAAEPPAPPVMGLPVEPPTGGGGTEAPGMVATPATPQTPAPSSMTSLMSGGGSGEVAPQAPGGSPMNPYLGQRMPPSLMQLLTPKVY